MTKTNTTSETKDYPMDKERDPKQWPARLTLKEKLQQLGISEQEFDFYCETFVESGSMYRIKEPGSEWIIPKRNGRNIPLSRNVIAYHLLGKYWISTFSFQITSHLCLDLDQSPSFVRNYNAIMKWLRTPPLVFQSSASKGLHIYIFLDFKIRSEKLFKITRHVLESKGVWVHPGACEIFPAENKSLRLPLGAESILRHPQTLRPISTNLNEAIKYIKANLRPYPFQELFPGLARNQVT
ncbi:MAG TPA: hypothetical protein PKV48_03725 [Thermodesulfobacteriota bacterium]|nr:hypothetical protein [Thermodesulfobacteriota bacterium]